MIDIYPPRHDPKEAVTTGSLGGPDQVPMSWYLHLIVV
jgi:hypothetical protein